MTESQAHQSPPRGANNDIVDSQTGKMLHYDSGDSDTLILCKVMGNAFYRREPKPGQNPLEVPMKRYRKGSEVWATPRVVRECPNMLVPVNPEHINPNAFVVGLTDVSGIGRQAAKALNADGIMTLEDLSKSNAIVVSRAAKVTESTAQKWVDEAVSLLEDVKAEEAGTAEEVTGAQAGMEDEYRRKMDEAKPKVGASIRQMAAAGGEYTGNVEPNTDTPDRGVQID